MPRRRLTAEDRLVDLLTDVLQGGPREDTSRDFSRAPIAAWAAANRRQLAAQRTKSRMRDKFRRVYAGC